MCYKEALEGSNKEDWVVSIKDEIKLIYKNLQTYQETKRKESV